MRASIAASSLSIIIIALASGCSSAPPPKKDLPLTFTLRASVVRDRTAAPVDSRAATARKQIYIETHFIEGPLDEKHPDNRTVQAPSLFVLDGEDAQIYVGEGGRTTLEQVEGIGLREVRRYGSGFVTQVRASAIDDEHVRVSVRAYVLRDDAVRWSAKKDAALSPKDELSVPMSGSW